MPQGFGVMVLGILLAAPAPALSPRSATLAGDLTTALTSQKLEAIAAQDPDDPDRFIAALLAPGQLLVIWARHGSPDAIRARLQHHQYREVYLDLQGSPIAGSSWFMQDMQADGLCAGRDQVADVLYDANSAATIFDGDWKSHGWSEQEYTQRLAAADQRYSRLLEVLLRQESQG